MSDSSWVEDTLPLGRQRPRARSISRASAGLLSLAIEAFVIVGVSIASGVAFHLASRGASGDITSFVATGAITAAIYCSLIRMAAPRSGLGAGLRQAIIAWCVTFLFLLVISFALKISAQFSRGTIFTFFAAGGLAACIARGLVPPTIQALSDAGARAGRQSIIIAPARTAAGQELAASLPGETTAKIIEYDDTCAEFSSLDALAQEVIAVARISAPGEIYIAPGNLPPSAIDSLLRRLRVVPRAIYLVPQDHVARLLCLEVQEVGKTLVIGLQKEPLSVFERQLKQLLDVLIAAVSLAIMAPLLLMIAVAIKAETRGPALFTQERLGYRGRPFRIFKFRTMRVMEDGEDIKQAVQGDDRTTRIGRVLRRTSIDELPQLLNVLRGDMSIIGPRPHAVAHDRLYSKLVENYEVRQHVKPGITGWAQVNGFRGATPNVDLMYRRIEMDIWYATNCSLSLDAKILVRTAYEVFRQTNAY